MAYSELMKSFHRIRPYLRSFYVYGFRHRQEYDAKSGRSYDNERRRVESWLGNYMKFGQDENGKRVFLSVDSRSIPGNPLFRAFRAKSFTDLDITLHFLLMDLLEEDEGLTLSGIQDALDEYLAEFDTARQPDESSLRKKLAEYGQLGLVRKEKQGKQALYYLESTPASLDAWADAAAFFSEAAPLGVVGSYLMDRLETRPDYFRFKHHYILNALDSEVLYALFLAMGEGRQVTIRQNNRSHELLPLRIYVSTQTGRQYVLGQSARRFQFFRLDLIDSVKPGEPAEAPPAEALQAFQRRVWGAATKARREPEHLEMVIHAEPEEAHIVQRLQREKRCGTVTALGGGDWLFAADVLDAVELLPWIRTFTGRVVSLRCANAEVEKRFYGDLAALRAMYGGDADAVQ
ncbi:MAG: WYL domain-containing protein [Aristaeellaceae bacterium]